MDFDSYLARCLQDPAFRAEWEAHEECRAEESRMVRRISRLSRLRAGYKAQRDTAGAEVRRLRHALMSAHADHCGRAHYQGDGVPCRCDTE